jgi:hypothetical protein
VRQLLYYLLRWKPHVLQWLVKPCAQLPSRRSGSDVDIIQALNIVDGARGGGFQDLGLGHGSTPILS